MKKGISPLISVVLLIALSIVISTIIMTWSTTLVKTQEDIIENKTKTAVECASADINIDSVYLDFTSNISRVNVRNSGQVDYQIISVSLVSDSGKSCIYSNATNLTTAPISLSKGEITTIEFNLTNVINTCANFSYAMVSTNCVGISDKFDGNPICVE